MVVPGIGVAAVAVAVPLRERLLIIALDAGHLAPLQHGKYPIGMGPGGPQIAQAQECLSPPPLRVPAYGLQSQVVAVYPAEDCNRLGHRSSPFRSGR